MSENNQTELHRITKNSNEPNNPNKIATKNSIGKLNTEKFKQVKQEFTEEVNNITSLEDANINVLKQRAEAFGNRAQRRELQKLLNDKLKKLEAKTPTENTTNVQKTEATESKPKPTTEKPVETPKTEEPKANQKSADIIKKSRSYKKIEKMIEESTDMSKVRAKLSNNPEFRKLSPTEQRQLIGKINQREALLETKASTPKGAQETSASKGTPKASNKEYSMMNWFDNLNDIKTPTLGALSTVKSVDENIVIPQDKVFDSQLDPNQEYAYEEEPVQAESVSETEESEESEVQEANEQDEVSETDNTEENSTTEESETTDETGTTDETETSKETEATDESEVNTGEKETPADDKGSATNGDKIPTTVSSSTPSSEANDNVTSRQNSTGTTVPPDNNRTNKTDVQARQVQEESAAEQTVSQDNLEERDIPAEQKYNITQKVLNAESDEEIADALQTLREVGRFKGRKNLRRLLKAKRKNNQERIQKYQEKVNSNINATNNAYKEKLDD